MGIDALVKVLANILIVVSLGTLLSVMIGGVIPAQVTEGIDWMLLRVNVIDPILPMVPMYNMAGYLLTVFQAIVLAWFVKWSINRVTQ